MLTVKQWRLRLQSNRRRVRLSVIKDNAVEFSDHPTLAQTRTTTSSK